jgi:hypothetical protein
MREERGLIFRHVLMVVGAMSILFAGEFLGYSFDRLAGDGATFGLYLVAATVGWAFGRRTRSRFLSAAAALVLCVVVGWVNMLFLRWLQLDIFPRMDEQVFGWFVPVYVGVLWLPSSVFGALIGAVVPRMPSSGAHLPDPDPES